MRQTEFHRLIFDICFMLEVHQAGVALVLDLFKTLWAADTHSFKVEVQISASIFLGCKLQEQERRIRDIINVVYFINRSVRLVNRRNGSQNIDYVSLDSLEQEYQEDLEAFVPSLSLDQYKALKKDILEAEQHLLRLLGYKLPPDYSTKYTEMLDILEIMGCPRQTIQDAVGLCNDSFIQLGKQESLDVTILGSIYLAARVNDQVQLFDTYWTSRTQPISMESVAEFALALLQSYQPIL